MSYPKTILTYHIASEAEVDKSLLESHGITVNLMNANTSRSYGTMFHIELQAPGEQVEDAISLLRELSPQRFGSPAAVKEISAGIQRALVRLLFVTFVCAIPLFIFVIRQPPLPLRVVLSLINGAWISGLILTLYSFLKPQSR
jgi:hypothetical protein